MAILLRGNTDGALKNLTVVLSLTLLLCFAQVSLSAAQGQTGAKSGRKVVRSVEPEYPVIVKHAHIGGSVRLTVNVLAIGDVTLVEPVGGNPIFVDSATKAVLKWKYIPAAAQTREEVQINFNPD